MAQPAAVRPARRLFDAAKDDGGDGYDGLLTELDDLLRGANPKPPPGGIDGTLPVCDSSVNGGPRLAADSQTAGDLILSAKISVSPFSNCRSIASSS